MIDKKIVETVASIISEVSSRGDKALEAYSLKFDNLKIQAKDFKISKVSLENAYKKVDPLLQTAIKKAAKNIEAFHLKEKKNLISAWSIKQNGSQVGQVYRPVEKAGIYIPGGKFPYLSTILMTAIPARIAGVTRIVMVTPPGKINNDILFTANLCGIKEVYQIGGAQAIAALALGTRTIPKVDLICGPGNVYVNEAKKQVFGLVGIDSLAGPSEVVILADSSSTGKFIAADLLAQAEHDKNAKAFLFSDSKTLIKEINSMIPKEYKSQIKITNCSMDSAIGQINKIAPEHLELAVKNAEGVISKIKNAGAIFVGSFTPTAVGDYWAGPSHVLPTGSSARFSSGLSVMTFMKRTSVIRYSKDRIKKDSEYINRLASAEGLVNHKNSVLVRG